jgi:Family of unknown function (DUF5686)/CarboxypepD_reg-like domain
MKYIFTLIVTALCIQSVVLAQTLSGNVVDENGDPLPFATIYFPDRKGGTATNEEGFYSIHLPKASFTMVFQYLGYKSQLHNVNLSKGDVTLNVTLTPQPIEIESVTVSAEREDPAYTIMRKAIAKAKYHTQQIDSFKTTVYVKGSGRLKGVPFIFRKKIEKELAKEGIDTSTSFTTESLSEITYIRPNTYKEKVISIRTIGEDNNSSPQGFIKSSFYKPQVNGAVSPLSPKAFAYYKFEYLGDFNDQGHLINKIKVTPRSRGDNVFEGTIYIVDQLWSIHSLDLGTYIWGILFEINQVYQPIEENVWLPLNNIFDVSGSFFGFKFEYRYFTNSTDYVIALNPDLEVTFDVIDDKIEREAADAADARLALKSEDSAIEKLASGDELSRKELRKILKEYEKQEQQDFEQDTLEDVIEITEYAIDTLAYKRDSTYWEHLRPIPLTKYEVKGYKVQDSIAIVTKAEQEAEGDTLTLTVGTDGSTVRAKKKSSFELKDIILGGSYSIGDNLRFVHKAPGLLSHFNTVDGFYTGVHFSLTNKSKSPVQWEISPFARYAFSRKAFNYSLTGKVSGGPKFEKWAVVIEGGNRTFQLNRDNPVDPIINDIWSMFFEQNYLKIYERDYLLLGFQKDFTPKFKLEIEVDWSRNRALNNTTDFKIFNNKNRSYTSNTPYNREIGDTYFPEYKATTVGFGLTFKPWSRFKIRNGRKSIINETTPTFKLNFRYGIPDLFGSEIDYTQLEGGFNHVFSFPAGGILNVNVQGGLFLSNNKTYFPDFKHFAGSQIPLTTIDPVGSFRGLDYYALSTSDKYISTNLFYQFRKLLATQILEVRLTGAKEGIFFNSLETPYSDHYMEVGYGLNYIFRIFRIEYFASFQDFKYTGSGIRVGVAANLETLFN